MHKPEEGVIEVANSPAPMRLLPIRAERSLWGRRPASKEIHCSWISYPPQVIPSRRQLAQPSGFSSHLTFRALQVQHLITVSRCSTAHAVLLTLKMWYVCAFYRP